MCPLDVPFEQILYFYTLHKRTNFLTAIFKVNLGWVGSILFLPSSLLWASSQDWPKVFISSLTKSQRVFLGHPPILSSQSPWLYIAWPNHHCPYVQHVQTTLIYLPLFTKLTGPVSVILYAFCYKLFVLPLYIPKFSVNNNTVLVYYIIYFLTLFDFSPATVDWYRCDLFCLGAQPNLK